MEEKRPGRKVGNPLGVKTLGEEPQVFNQAAGVKISA
jgi:hypothetical protein